ncbi:ankyrin repeat-containing protein ITN1-like [Cucurbita pepo subsp. pepo]|uniref:ankyrin repeat-containing protein ITN1-like n=1 Tax=Cucurbita pepo subsp. pepo TaxID=3664 RepID=UPI000C9D3BC8|nr:ankyrin repeat-containing protein ITN1-like [Cucurbita pepo subsp. pepo]
MIPFTRRPSTSSSTKSTPGRHDGKAVRWSEPVTGVDSPAVEDRNAVNNDEDDDDFEVGEDESPARGDEENPLPLEIYGKPLDPKTKDVSWPMSKFHSFRFSKSRRMDNRPLRVQLYQAAQNGDWKTAEYMNNLHPGVLTMVISDRCETVLHIATRAKKASFVKELVNFLDRHDLGLKNKYGNTALCIAAASGAVDIAKLMVSKFEALPLIRGSGNSTPVLIAARYKHKHMVSYLLSKTPVYGSAIQEQMELLVGAISADYYDIALLILKWNPLLVLERDFNDDTPLHIMARRSNAIGKKNKPTRLQSYIIDCEEQTSNLLVKGIKRMHKHKLMQIQAHQMVELMWSVVLDEIPEDEILQFIMFPTSILHDAARVGNVEFLRLIINSYPDLAWKVDSDRKSIFHVAVENRQESVFSLIYEMGEFLDYLPFYFDEENISLLELAAKKADLNHLNRVSGAAFQMHKELLWFKEVEKIVELTMRRKKGKRNPRELFTKEHQNLVEEGEKWMKKTANSCMLVATLIATVVFAAIFTVPGGNNNNHDINTGSPLFLRHKWFTVFVISDATALISSSTSILLFLSILTSRCAEEDFLIWLPLKLVCGLGTLFLSVLSMVLAFSATFFLFYGKDTDWVPLLVAGMAIVPVYCFGVLQFRLWADAVAALQASYYLYFKNWKFMLF